MSIIYSVIPLKYFFWIVKGIQNSVNQQDWIIWLISFLAIEAVPEWSTSEQSAAAAAQWSRQMWRDQTSPVRWINLLKPIYKQHLL